MPRTKLSTTALLLLLSTALAASAAGPMTFASFQVPATTVSVDDLYEPFVYVAPTGIFYITAHVAAKPYTERTPAFAGILAQQGQVQWLSVPGENSTPGDEGVFAADDSGNSWLFDNGPSNMPLYRFCANLLYECDYSADAWGQDICGTTPLTPDRPWESYSSFNGGMLLLQNSGLPPNALDWDTSHVAQIGTTTMTNPPTFDWNPCAGTGYVPGPGSLRPSDGMIAVPQAQKDAASWHMFLIHGMNVHSLITTKVFDISATSLHRGKNFGFVSFSKTGTLYLVAIDSSGLLHVATSQDLSNFGTATLALPQSARGWTDAWISGSQTGEGALLTFVTYDGYENGAEVYSFYAAHVTLTQGLPSIQDPTPVIQDQPNVCGDLSGSSIGPDGRAYVMEYSTPSANQLGCGSANEHPLTLWVQDSGPVV